MAFGLGSFFVRLGFDGSEFTRGVNTAAAQADVFGRTITTAITNPLLGTISVVQQAGGALLRAADQVLATAERTKLLADASNVSTDTMQALVLTLQDAGLGASEAEVLFRKLTDVIGTARAQGGPLKATLESLIGPLKDFTANDEGIRRLVEQVASLTDAQERARVASDLFGRGGAAVAQAVAGAGGEIDQLVESYGRVGRIINAQAIPDLLKVDDKVDQIKGGIDGLIQSSLVEFLSGIGSQLDPTLNTTESIARLIKEIGPVIRELGADIGQLADSVDKLVSNTQSVDRFFRALGNAIELTGLTLGATGSVVGNLANLDVQGAYRGVASRAARARQIGRDDADYLREFRR